MTDHPRFHMGESAPDREYRAFHGAPQVELLFRVVDWWLARRLRYSSESDGVSNSPAAKQAFQRTINVFPLRPYLIALGFGLLNVLLALLGSNRTQPHSLNS